MPRVRALTRPGVWLLVVALVLAGLASTGATAWAVEPIHITGTVTDTSGTSLKSVLAGAWRKDDNGWRMLGSGQTDPAGHFDITSLPAGTYRLSFEDSTGVYSTEYYDNAATLDTATDIVVTAGATTSGINAELAPRGPIHITGTVTDNGGVPVANVEVDARVQCSCEGFATVGEAQTAEDGTYDLVIAPITEPYYAHNTFYVLFDSPAGDYAPEWYDNGASVFDATPIYVADGGTASDKNVRLAPGSHVTGTVTGPGGAPVAGAYVSASGADYDNWGAEFYTRTAEDGSYDLGPLPASTYNLEFRSDDYHGKMSGVVVAAGETLRKDARLGYRLYVRNTQRPAITGKPKVGQRVRATTGSWNPAQVTLTYRWRVAGRWVAGARHPFYRPRAADAGKRLRVRIRATAPGRGAATATSPAKTVAKVTLRVTTKLKVPGRD